tara:strand:- start:80 stop:406 length:327 start_codon:yes stop_codon:yes gene_type:complete
MPSKSKAKGNRIERLVVNEFEEYDIKSQRAWGSDGRSLGLNEEVDVVADIFPGKDRIKIQVKGRRHIADYMKPDTSLVDMQVLKEDREELLAVLPLSTLLAWLKLKEC